MKAKLVIEALKDVLLPRSKEDLDTKVSPVFFDIYKKSNETWDLKHYRGGTLSIHPRSPGLPFFGLDAGDWVFQILSTKDKKIIAEIFHKSEYRNPLEIELNSFEELENLVNEYKDRVD